MKNTGPLKKSVARFYSFPTSLRGVLAVKMLPALKYGTNMSKYNKSAS